MSCFACRTRTRLAHAVQIARTVHASQGGWVLAVKDERLNLWRAHPAGLTAPVRDLWTARLDALTTTVYPSWADALHALPGPDPAPYRCIDHRATDADREALTGLRVVCPRAPAVPALTHPDAYTSDNVA